MLLSPIAVLISGIAVAYFVSKRLYRYLQFLQQEEYDARRFVRWILDNKAFDTKGSIAALSGFLIIFLSGFISLRIGAYVSFFIAVLLIVVVSREDDPRVSGKITLKLTDRAKRIYRFARAVALLYQCALCIVFALKFNTVNFAFFWLCQLCFIQATPVFLILAVAALAKEEKARQDAFLNEAKEKYKRIAPYTVGITGSYGKTSTKSLLGQISEVALGPTFWPQKGINTPMGITREIRERLEEGHSNAVIEMGAYRRGSIKHLCELTPPQAAIITAVGIMHLDRMGSADNVLLAKSELAQAVPDDGILVCNADNAGSLEIARRHPKKTTLLYGIETEDKVDARIKDISFAVEGTSFTVVWKGKDYSGFVPMHGRPALSNILASFCMAVAQGADPELVLASVRTLAPVNNRLEVKKTGVYTQINDAYNSNPVGFTAALEVLESLPAQRRILVTPGMIELGDSQYEENVKVAQNAGRFCDFVIVVGDLNRNALVEGLKKGGMSSENIFEIPLRDDALKFLASKVQSGDLVLIENDLPDLYEVELSL
jgi:UDP-N-acetylmuramoyl-tripeptide--D-alanyl-D-alanine ligase